MGLGRFKLEGYSRVGYNRAGGIRRASIRRGVSGTQTHPAHRKQDRLVFDGGCRLSNGRPADHYVGSSSRPGRRAGCACHFGFDGRRDILERSPLPLH